MHIHATKTTARVGWGGCLCHGLADVVDRAGLALVEEHDSCDDSSESEGDRESWGATALSAGGSRAWRDVGSHAAAGRHLQSADFRRSPGQDAHSPHGDGSCDRWQRSRWSGDGHHYCHRGGVVYQIAGVMYCSVLCAHVRSKGKKVELYKLDSWTLSFFHHHHHHHHRQSQLSISDISGHVTYMHLACSGALPSLAVCAVDGATAGRYADSACLSVCSSCSLSISSG